MTAVKIKGTFKKDSRPNNGLEAIAEEILKDEFTQWTCVVVLQFHTSSKARGEAPSPTVELVAIEPVFNEAGTTARELMNQARRERGKDNLPETLFAAAGAGDPANDKADDGPVAERPKDGWLDPGGDTGKAKKGRG